MKKNSIFLILLIFVSLATQSFAAGVLAGSEIKLQSTATYVDGIGQQQTVSSNEVIVIVSSKYGVSLNPSANPTTLTVAAGGVADYSYVLTNTGNDFDSYTFALTPTLGTDGDEISIYYDADLNGQVDAGDLLIATTGAGTPVAFPEIGPDDLAGFIVRIVTDSNSATTGATDISADFTITSVGDNSVTDSRTGITANLSAGSGVLSYYADANTEVAGVSDTITFTLSGSNVGENGIYGQAGIPFESTTKDGVLVEFDLTEGISVLSLDGANGATTYAGVTINSRAPSAGVVYYWNDVSDEWSDDNTVSPGTDARIALFLEDPGTGAEILEIGQEFNLEFAVPSRANISETVVRFTGNSTFDVDAAATAGSTPSNTLTLRIGADSISNATYTADIEPYNGAAPTTTIALGGARASFQHPAVRQNPAELVNNALALLEVNTLDVTDAQTRSAGEEVYIPLTVNNPTGGASEDTYNITIASNNQAALVAVEILQADGITPLQDTNGDGVRDTGLIAATEYKDIVVRLIIDESANLTSATTIVVRSTSSNGSATDTTTINIDEILPAGVDIAIAGLSGDVNAANDNPAAAIVLSSGNSANLAVDVQNVRTANAGATNQLTTGDFDAYNLTYTSTGGLVVKFYEDLDDSDSLEDSELNEILNTDSLSPVIGNGSNIFHQMAQVIAPDGTPAGIYTVTLNATSTNNSSITDSITLSVEVSGVSSLDLEPEVFVTAVAGGNIVVRHTILNSGNQTATTVTASLTAPLPAGYVAYWTNSAGANLGTGTTNNDPGNLNVTPPAPGTTATIFLRIGVPSSVPAGTTLSFEVQATNNTGASDSVVDVLQVVAGNMELVKEQSKTNGSFQISPLSNVAPGESIFYRTTFENLGSQSLANVIIHETIPEFTTLANTTVTVVDPTAGAASTEFSSDGGITWSAAAGTLSNVTNIRVVLNGPLLPGQSGTVVYEVTVKQ